MVCILASCLSEAYSVFALEMIQIVQLSLQAEWEAKRGSKRGQPESLSEIDSHKTLVNLGEVCRMAA